MMKLSPPISRITCMGSSLSRTCSLVERDEPIRFHDFDQPPGRGQRLVPAPRQPRGTPREMATAWGRWPAILKLLVKIIATSFPAVIKVLVEGFPTIKLEPTSYTSQPTSYSSA